MNFSLFRSVVTVSLIALTAACSSPRASQGGWFGQPERPEAAQQYSDFLIGRYASLSNNPSLAAETFTRAIDRERSDPILLERAVFSLLLAGDRDEAVRISKRGLDELEDPASLTRLTAGLASITDNDFDDARSILRDGDFGAFNRVVARSVSAWAALGEGDMEAARSHLVESLIGDDVLDGVSLYMLAILQLAAGDDTEARSTFDAVWGENMRLAVAAEQYMRLLAHQDDIETAIEVGETFRSQIGRNPAVDTLTAKLKAGETVNLRRLSARQGAALSVYALAAALAAETRYADATNDVSGVYFQLALMLDPSLDVARTLLGDTLERAERRFDAEAILAEVQPDSPFYATAQGQRAWVLRRMERNEEAIDVARTARELTGDRDLTIQLGDLYRSVEDYENAYTYFNEVVMGDEAIGRRDWRAYYARAITHHQLDRWPEAERDFLTALEIDPNQAAVLNYLGYSWVDRGENLEEAFRLIQKAVSLRPNEGYIVDSLGWAYYRLGQYDKAVKHLERAVELSPNDPTLNDHLGDAYWRVGRRLEAEFQWRHALDLEPEDDDFNRIHKKLAEGLDPNGETRLSEDQNFVGFGERQP